PPGRIDGSAGLGYSTRPVADALANLEFAPQVGGFAFAVASAGGDEIVDGLQNALARLAVVVRVDGLTVIVDGLHQLGRTLEGTADGRFEIRRIVDVDQLRSGTTIVEGHHRLAGQQKFVERRAGVRTHHVGLVEQFQNIVVVGKTEVVVL